MMRAIVTGATGFIGSHLVEHLRADGWEIAALARPAAAGLLESNAGIAKVYVHNDTTHDVIESIADFRPNVVFHLASLFLATHTSSHVEGLISSNILLGTRVLEAMKATGVNSFINTGSSWQNYQSDSYVPVNLYAATKQAFEDILSYYAEAAGIRAVTLRLYDSYGPGDTRHKLLRLLLDCLKTGVPLAMSPGEQMLDLVHVDDLCRAYLSAAALVGQLKPGNTVYAVSGGQRRTLRQVVATLEQAVGRPIPAEFGATGYRDREVMNPWIGPPLPGWEPRIDLLEGFHQLAGSEPGLDRRDYNQ